MPPTPPPRPRADARALLLVTLPPLLLGFATGVMLAAPVEDSSRPVARAMPAPATPDAREDEAHRAGLDVRRERARRRARARLHERTLAATDAVAAVAVGPTRRSVQAAIDATDPRPWLAAYGTVVERPLEVRPSDD